METESDERTQSVSVKRFFVNKNGALEILQSAKKNTSNMETAIRDANEVVESFLLNGDATDDSAGALSGSDVLFLDEAKLTLTQQLVNCSPEHSRRLGRSCFVGRNCFCFTALNPERVEILPDGEEDHWNEGYEDLISLSRDLSNVA